LKGLLQWDFNSRNSKCHLEAIKETIVDVERIETVVKQVAAPI